MVLCPHLDCIVHNQYESYSRNDVFAEASAGHIEIMMIVMGSLGLLTLGILGCIVGMLIAGLMAFLSDKNERKKVAIFNQS